MDRRVGNFHNATLDHGKEVAHRVTKMGRDAYCSPYVDRPLERNSLAYLRSMRILVFSILAHFTTAGAQPWSQLPNFPGTARDDASAFTIGDQVYVGTGRDVSFALMTDWYTFDLESQTWAPVAELPASGRQYCSTFTDGTYGYLFGGVDDNGPLNELWRYDPVLNTWTEMDPLPGPGRYATVAFDNGMVCTGLLDGGIATNECWQYNTGDGSWTARTGVPGPARHRASGSGGLVLVIGGADAEGNALSDVYSYEADAWWPMEDLPASRIGADAISDHDLGATVVVGGASSPTQFHAEAWVRSNGGWSSMPDFSGGPRRGGVLAFVAPIGNVRYLLYGTGVDQVQRHNDWWVYAMVAESIPDHDHARVSSHPNPRTGRIHISFPWRSTPSYTVHDVSGRTLTSGHLHQEGSLDLSTLSTGEYIIRIIDGDHHYHSRASIIRP